MKIWIETFNVSGWFKNVIQTSITKYVIFGIYDNTICHTYCEII